MELNHVRTGPRGAAPVVLLHSAGLDLTYWDRQIEALRTDHDVVAVDLPGHGRSPGTPGDMTVAGMAASVASLVAGLDAGPVHLVGLSLGGVVAQSLAVDHPALVSSLVLVDTGARFGAAAQAGMRARAAQLREHGVASVLDGLFGHWFLPATLRDRPDLVDRATTTLLAADPEVQAALWEMIADVDRVADLARIAVPTVVVVGEHDSSSPVATAAALAEGIAGARLHVVRDAAHLSPIERPEAVSRLLLDVLDPSTPR